MFLVARQASGVEEQRAVGGMTSPAPASEPTASAAAAAPAESTSPVLGPACEAALVSADAALERSVALDEALGRHTQIMDELLAERIDAAEALDRALPVLTDAATDRRRFQQDLSAYSQSREECRS